MLGRIEQLLVFVLAVQLDELVREILQRCGRRERTVDERAASALAGDLAPDDDLVTVGAVEDGLDRRKVLAGPEQVLGGAPAEQQADGLDQD